MLVSFKSSLWGESSRLDSTACSLVLSACQKAMKGLPSRHVLAQVRHDFLHGELVGHL